MSVRDVHSPDTLVSAPQFHYASLRTRTRTGRVTFRACAFPEDDTAFTGWRIERGFDGLVWEGRGSGRGLGEHFCWRRWRGWELDCEHAAYGQLVLRGMVPAGKGGVDRWEGEGIRKKVNRIRV